MSESGDINVELESSSGKKVSSKNVDIDELDYEEFDEGNKTKAVESDGEIKSDDEGEKKKSKRRDVEEGEESDESEGRRRGNHQENKEEEKPLSEEEGEINDGEKVRKAFVPRVPCKFYQRGKCSWGRNCKFLHPGVNDTGNYTFLEVGDPNARVYQQSQMQSGGLDDKNSPRDLDQMGGSSAAATQQNETAWEKALRNAREMKEKAKQRKMQEQKEEFLDKQMNLSLKEFENEKENDERYMNIENAVIADDDLRDDDLEQYRGRMEEIRKTSSAQQQQLRNRLSYDANPSGGPSRSRGRDSDRRGSPSRKDRGGPAGADTWHDPWDRSRNTASNKPKRGGARGGGRDDRSSYSYSSSASSSRSRSRSSSTRSSYSSSSYSSRSNSRSSYSSRSPSPGSKQRKTGVKKTSTKTKSSHQSSKSVPKIGAEVATKKTVPTPAPPAAGTAGKKNRSRSNSASSYSSKASNESMSESENSSVESYSDEEKGKKRTKTAKSGGASKRSAPEGKDKSDVKKSRVASSPPPGASSGTAIKDKKQQIKDHLKQLENALKRKAMAK